MVGIFPLGPRDLLRQPFLVKRLGFRTHTLFFFDSRELLENCFQLKGQVIFGRFCILFQPSILHCFLKFSGSSFLQRCYSSLLSLSILTTVKMFISFLRSFFFSPLFFFLYSLVSFSESFSARADLSVVHSFSQTLRSFLCQLNAETMRHYLVPSAFPFLS